MTVEIKLVDVVDAINNLSIAGVNIKSLDNIPESALSSLPVFYPVPNGFITEMQWSRETLGTDATKGMNLSYTLHYKYLHAVVGSGGGLLAVYSGMIIKIILILKAIFADSNLGEAVDVTLQGISDIGVHTDPAGQTQYHGVDISIRVLEFIQ